MLPFPKKAILLQYLQYTTDSFSKKLQPAMWSDWWRHNDVNIILPATGNNCTLPGKLASGDLKFFENFYQIE